MSEGYRAEIVDSIKPLEKREKINIKLQTSCNSIQDMLQGVDSVIIENVVNMATLHVTNPASKNVEYDIYTLIDAEGEMYSTSSFSLCESFNQIAEDTLMDDGEPVSIKIFKKPSKNKEANGGSFYTCTIF